jgi:hypothetical protein
MPITAALAPPPPGGFPTGLLPSPRHVLAAAKPFYSPWAPPVSQFALVPKQLDYWGNNQYGDCVSAEEAFRCACDNPEDFIPASVVIDWARKHGVLNGADLPDVLDKQARGGFTVGQNTYNAGGKQTVDYSNEATLRSALCMGPVKLGMDHAALPSGAGNQQGWYALGTGRSYRSEDHCTALCGFGPAGWLYQQLGVALPSALKADQQGYLHYTWSTIGFVDHAWIMSTVGEAWIRHPNTVIVGPQPQPTPPDVNPPLDWGNV